MASHPARERRSRLPRWLLGSALLIALAVAVGFALRPPSVPPEGTPVDAKFVDVTDRAGIRFRHVSGAGQKLLPETMGAGVAVLDFDRDGRPDLFFVNGRLWPGDTNSAFGRATQALYRNRGDGTFEDVTAASGLDIPLYGMGVAVADYDNDGWPDVFITAIGGSRLFRNVGGTRFEDVTVPAGLDESKWPNESAVAFARRADPISFPSSAAWLDYDGDGRLDLFVCHYVTWSPAHDLGVAAVLPGGRRAYVPPQQFPGAQCQLLHNVDGTRFEDVSATAGVLVTEPGNPARPVGKALGVVVCDPDGDGWPDVIVANDTVRNFFFHNQAGPTGGRVFQEAGLFAGLAYADGRPRGGMGIDAGEIAPGALTVVVANFTHEPNSLFRLRKPNPILFTDVAAEAGLGHPSQRPMKFGAVFFDFDRDGRLDLFTANGHLEPDIGMAQPGQTHAQPGQLFWNTGRPRETFVPLKNATGGDLFPPMVGRGCAYLDYDGDGKLDLVVTENGGRARLFRNETPDDNGWVRLVLVGDGRTNRDAIGAEVTVFAGGTVQRRYVTPSHGYLSQCESAVYFGLGPTADVDRVAVRWPGRDVNTQEWQNISGRATYRLSQDSPGAVRLDR
ncbi:CRTAC1 family protein [Limnoglobus roseus]|uniref:CRTAC1 family protein n=1 Tax=Limnoglobus roseus TaxID=2598579 RepID=A0A5C1A4F0_9BACT|nr:CRTAC1 family protein [Limnoglobus roseus]QEL13520.1 CRTAC1 family protein [Limnoglobus roseus]